MSPFKNVINKMCLQIIYSMYMYKEGLALNNVQWLICHKTQPNQGLVSLFKGISTFVGYLMPKNSSGTI